MTIFTGVGIGLHKENNESNPHFPSTQLWHTSGALLSAGRTSAKCPRLGSGSAGWAGRGEGSWVLVWFYLWYSWAKDLPLSKAPSFLKWGALGWALRVLNGDLLQKPSYKSLATPPKRAGGREGVRRKALESTRNRLISIISLPLQKLESRKVVQLYSQTQPVVLTTFLSPHPPLLLLLPLLLSEHL